MCSSDLALRKRVMVCLGAGPNSVRLLRRAARLAAALHGPLLALVVLDPHRFLSRGESVCLEHCERLCSDRGGEFLRLQSRKLLESLVVLARQRGISQIVLGQSRANRANALFSQALSLRLQRALNDEAIDLHLIAQPTVPGHGSDPGRKSGVGSGAIDQQRRRRLGRTRHHPSSQLSQAGERTLPIHLRRGDRHTREQRCGHRSQQGLGHPAVRATPWQ